LQAGRLLRAWDYRPIVRKKCIQRSVLKRSQNGEADELAIQEGLDAQVERDAVVQQQAKEYKAFNATLEVGCLHSTEKWA
jgi:hypothetical protein